LVRVRKRRIGWREAGQRMVRWVKGTLRRRGRGKRERISAKERRIVKRERRRRWRGPARGGNFLDAPLSRKEESTKTIRNAKYKKIPSQDLILNSGLSASGEGVARGA
jgi:hypothetical protein